MVMHEDEHAILREILRRTVGDDDCFAKIVSCDRSDLGRAQDRLVLARFFERMERQFALRAEERAARSAKDHRALVVRRDNTRGPPEIGSPTACRDLSGDGAVP
jgi:hypothetical protein